MLYRLVAIIVACVAVLNGCQQSKSDAQVAPIDFTQAKCAYCAMPIAAPGFAAQLHTADDRIRSFDDPGCLALFAMQYHVDVRAMLFRHLEEDRWLRRGEVGFIRHSSTPMAFGFAATDKGAPGAVALDAVESDLRDRFLKDWIKIDPPDLSAD